MNINLVNFAPFRQPYLTGTEGMKCILKSVSQGNRQQRQTTATC